MQTTRPRPTLEPMSAKWQQEYADAIDAVERKRAAGTMTEGEAAAWRQRLLSEMDAKTRPSFWQGANRIALALVGIFAAGLVLFLVLRYAFHIL